MTVKELIEKLKELPQDARVFHLWDGVTKEDTIKELLNLHSVIVPKGTVCEHPKPSSTGDKTKKA